MMCNYLEAVVVLSKSPLLTTYYLFKSLKNLMLEKLIKTLYMLQKF